MIAIDLSKKRALDVDLKAMQQINSNGNLGFANYRVIFFVTEEVKETVSDFSQGTVKVLWICFTLI